MRVPLPRFLTGALCAGALASSLALASSPSVPEPDAVAINVAIASGDAAWARRAEGHDGPRAAPGPIDEAIAAYEDALSQDPTSAEARWKLMRALYFRGNHVVVERDAKLEVFDRGRALGEEGIDRIAAEIGGRERLGTATSDELRAAVADPTGAAEILFWSAVHTGMWGETRGKLAAAREGVAAKIRDYADASVAFDRTIENGGGHRVLGRLHTEAPKIPFITGWVDRDLAVAELEACLAIAPHDLTTRLYLGEALVEFEPRRKDEGLRLLRGMIEETPDPDWLVEGLQAIADAKSVLARHVR